MKKKHLLNILFPILFTYISMLSAQDGSLDNTFGSGGVVITDINNSHDTANSIAIQSDGKIVVAGNTQIGSDFDLMVVRYNTDGSLDDTFNGDGKVTYNIASLSEEWHAVDIQGDGKIVIAGTPVDSTFNIDFSVVRLNTDGSLDSTFGEDGIVMTAIGPSTDQAFDLAIQPDGKIVVVGISFDDGSVFAVVRYLDDGSLDSDFGNNGIVTTAFGNYPVALSMGLQSNGKIVVGGKDFSQALALVRYNSNGTLDSTFNDSGIIITDMGYDEESFESLVIQADNKIVVLGGGTNYNDDGEGFADIVLIRYNNDGTYDNTFGDSGMVVTDIGRYDSGFSMALQSDEKIVVPCRITDVYSDFGLIRYNSDGSLDGSFGEGGLSYIDGSYDISGLFDVAIQDDGKIVASGHQYNSDRDIAVLRFLASATIELEIDYLEGWNIVGLPLYVEDASYGTLFTDAVNGTLYGYEGSYYGSDVLETGNGYWLVFTNDGSADISGEAITNLTISLSEGWNLITGISSPVAVESISDPGDIIVSGTIYGYGGSYYNADAIEPGKGYWLNAFADGDITFGEGLARSRPVFEDMTAGANTLTINGQDLYFGIDIPADKMMSYSLPPKPPSGAFDIRFSGDTRIAMDKAEIEVMNPSQTLTISYDIIIDAGDHMSWILISESGNEFTLEGSGEITIPTEETFTLERKAIIPITYTLHQNYPNPFNPITSLRYDLPEQAQVTLTIYDLIGREVAQLINTTQKAGYKSIQWNATDMHGKPVSAGVYLYQIRSGEFVQTRKMVLLK